MSASMPRTRRVVAFTLALVVLTTAVAPVAASATGTALTSPQLAAPPASMARAPVPGTTCSRPPEIALTVDSDLRVRSNISAWSIDRFLALATPLPSLGAAFKLAEARYRVNALYLLAHAMLESDFGRSYIAQNFKNLFGWTAYDRDPVAYATRFPSFAASIDYVAMRISETYLDPAGVHYGGAPTLRGMYRYATDPLWESSIARIANALCLPTLDGRGLVLSSALTATELRPGEFTELLISAEPAVALPDGLRLAARARATGATAAGGADVTLRAEDLESYALTAAASEDGAFRLPVEAGAIPGTYTLEFLLLDSDGGVLPPGDRIPVPPVTLHVVARHAVSYSLTETSVGLIVSLQSVGREAIPAGGGRDGLGGDPTTLEVLYVADGIGDSPAATPVRPMIVAEIPITAAIEPGASRGFQLPPDARLSGPGTLFVRLLAAGDDGLPLELPTAAFRLTQDVQTVGAGAGGALSRLVITPLNADLPTTAPAAERGRRLSAARQG